MEEAPQRRGRGKPRDQNLRETILKAAAELLLEKGFKGFTIEEVAARSGASKVTIYRWLNTRGTLALDAYMYAVTDAFAFGQSESPRADIERQLAAVIEKLTRTAAGRAIMELIGGAQEDPQLKRELAARYIQPRRELAGAAFARLFGWDYSANKERLAAITDQVYGAIYNRLLFGLEPLDASFARELVDFWADRYSDGRR